jgi:hypothetical protein
VIDANDLTGDDVLLWRLLQMCNERKGFAPGYAALCEAFDWPLSVLLYRLRRLELAKVIRWQIGDPRGLKVMVKCEL